MSNPFRSSRVRPGAIPYLFPAESHKGDFDSASAERLNELVAAFVAHGRRGAIIGPHGSGKSTLVAAFLPALESAGHHPRLIELHDGQRKLPREEVAAALREGAKTLVIDGYEQLGLMSRVRLRRLLRKNHLGLVVTAHKPGRIPVLTQTAVTPEGGAKVVARLLADEPALIERYSAKAAALLAPCAGNLREVLFALYDDYENERRQPSRRVAQ